MKVDEQQCRQWLPAIAAGSEEAYRALFLHVYTPLYRFALSIIKSHEAAEEIVSDVLLKVWQQRERLARIEQIRLYLYVAIKNTALNYQARASKNLLERLEDHPVEWISTSAGPEELFLTAEMQRRIQLAVQQLPPRCRVIYQLIREYGLKHKEVAELLGISQKTVEAQMGIALRKIAEALAPQMDKPVKPEAKQKTPGE
ncbi:RNA polymerase sigma-70 factor [Thermoflavifilum thermophilum]|uniref:RNA polymerase sigma-70 factor, ECF subfamily n=1 Tax=Thermoflavifilum thermophilum TaxID=1393122 RepID=A0A1I7N0E6_9BACT|nr:RNA polymerase sigma-70 factor [Thermoflavifilum thermophilum]SFV28098.1 RNA polymerase sigma-70 factor, ECF subfamily [Thermoflavifilum thermophilum]